jgi:hypothetical protein
MFGLVVSCFAFLTPASPLLAQNPKTTRFPQYDHVFLIVEENESYDQVIGNPFAPIMNELANSYGSATDYRGVADPSEPNYIAMLGGDFFGISSDDPYWFPGQTVHAENLMSQLEGAGLTWRGYFQNMPYPGYRGYCYPNKCNGIPDADTQYVSKHNGIVNFANMQTPEEFGKMFPIEQLDEDLVSGDVPSFGYIVPDECDDSHGAPPWCVDSNNFGTVQQNYLIARMDKYAGKLVDKITSSPFWKSGNNAIMITFDEGNYPTSRVVMVVITSHGPRGVKDTQATNHYSLLASLQQTFGLGCLRNSCSATPLTKLFTITGSSSLPALPPPYDFPTSKDTFSAQGPGKVAEKAILANPGWTIVPSRNIDDSRDNVLAGVSAASATDAWAVGNYYPVGSQVLATLGEHFDGERWTTYPLPNVGVQENSLLSVSMTHDGSAWAVGYFVDGRYRQRTLVEHFDGKAWKVVPSHNPGALQNLFYGVSAIADDDVWAVGAEQDGSGLWHTLAEHWDGADWSVVPAVDAGSNGNQLYAVKALAANDVYAAGQQAGPEFPGEALIEHWDGREWKLVPSPATPSATVLPLGIEATPSHVTIVGQHETDTSPYTTYVASGAPKEISIRTTPNNGTGENDLFGVAIAADGSKWAAGWDIIDSSDDHAPLVLHGIDGVWSLVPTPSFAAGTDNGFGAITAIPGGGLWAVGVQTNSQGNYSTLIEYHP